MPVKVEFNKEDLAKVKDLLGKLSEEQQRSLMVKSINDSVRTLHASMKGELAQFIDRPKQITLNSLKAGYANSQFLNGFIEFKEFLGKQQLKRHWLAPLVFGGERSDKGLDKALRAAGILPGGKVAVPTKDIRTDGYGNVPGPYVTKMISYLRIDQSNTQNRSRKKKQRRNDAKWFVMREGNNRMKPGIYEYREGGLGRKVRMVFMFESVRYRKTYPFFEKAQEYANSIMTSRLVERIRNVFR